MEAKIGTTVFFSYDGEEYERDIESIKVLKNLWIGRLGYGIDNQGDNVMFFLHGNVDKNGRPVMEDLVIQVEGVGSCISEFVED